jgi:hypothetical protein
MCFVLQENMEVARKKEKARKTRGGGRKKGKRMRKI